MIHDRGERGELASDEPRTDTEFSARFCTGRPAVLGLTDIPADVRTLHFVEASKDFERLLEYPTVSAISINNVAMTASSCRALRAASAQLARIETLQIWNCAKLDLELLSLFPAVRFLQLTHKNARKNDWSRLSVLPQLRGLFLIDATDLTDLALCAHLGEKLSTLSVLGARSLRTAEGIEHVAASLARLTLWVGREHPTRKRFGPIALSPVGALQRLASLSVSGLDFDEVELADVLRRSSHLAELELDPWQLELRTYAKLRNILPRVCSDALQPAIEAGDSVWPVGKGSKRLERGSADFEERYARLLASWDDALGLAGEGE